MLSRILLADVSPNIQQMVSQALAAEQIETVFASDGWSALNLLNETTPDLLIAEISLPEKSGYELCRYVRTEPEFQSLPVILLDHHFDAFNQSVAHSIGADIYLSKPFDTGSVVGAVRSLLESRGDTYSEDRAPAPVAQTRQQSPPEGASAVGRDVRQDGKRIVMGGHPPDGRAIIASSPHAVLSRPQTRRRISPLRWAALAGAMLAVIGLAILERTLTARNTPPVQGPRVVSPTIEQQSSSDDKTGGDAGPSSERLAESAQQKEEPGNASADSERAPEVGNTVSSEKPGEAGEQSRPRAAHGQAQSSTGATGTRSAESPPSASTRGAPYDALPDNSPVVTGDQRYGSARRPRSVSSIRPATAGGHLKRGGHEMREAGEHFGSGVKHFWKSGEKAAVRTGKKVGGGVKRMGQALKKIF
ncbi:MAG TPA: response regulator [Blastocatellia bacterium]